MPGSPAPPALHEDDRFRAFAAFCADARAALADRTWDNLAHVEKFAAAAVLARAFLADYPASHERRRVVHALHALLPPSLLVDAGAPAGFAPFAPEVAARAPDFRLHPGDVPKIAPSFSAFLAEPGVVDAVFASGSRLLVPRGLCPAAAQPGAACIFVELVDGAPLPPAGPATATSLPAPAQYRARAVVDGAPVDVRVGADRQPILGVDGKPQPLAVPADVVTAWLFSAGPDARGLDLRSADDRALLLAYAHELKHVDVGGRSAFAWLEDNGTPLDKRVDVVAACVDAAARVVERHALDPLACRIRLRKDGGDGAWQARAAALLDETGLFHDVVTRASGPVPSLSSPPDARAEGERGRDIVWLSAFAPPSFAAGRASALAQGRMFARLATSLLAPLGVLPQSGLKDASGRVLLTRLVPRAGGGVAVVHRAVPPAAPESLPLAEPKGAPRHDVAAMPAWLAFFLEGLS